MVDREIAATRSGLAGIPGVDGLRLARGAVDPAALAAEVRGVAALVRHIVRDGAAAEDVAQEAWLRAIATDRPAEVSAHAWLAGIARNLARRLVRTEARRANRELADVAPASAEPTVDLVVRAE